MKEIKIDTGRFFRRYVNDGNILVGCVFIDPSIQLEEGQPCLLFCDDKKCFLFSDPQSNTLKKLTLDQKNYGIDGMLTSPMWPGTNDPRYRVVHLIKQFEKENGWLVFGPSKDKKVMKQWLIVKDSVCSEDAEAYDTVGDKIGGIVRQPLWPHPDGRRYALIPNFKEITQSFQELHQLYVASAVNSKVLRQLQIHHRNVFTYVLDSNGRSLEKEFVAYLAQLNKKQPLTLEQPKHSDEIKEDKLLHSSLTNFLFENPLRVDEKSIEEMLNNPASSKEAAVALIAAPYLSSQTAIDQTQAWNTVTGNDWLFLLGSLRPSEMNYQNPMNPLYQKVFEQWVQSWTNTSSSNQNAITTPEMIDYAMRQVIKDCGEHADDGFAPVLLNACQTDEQKKMLLVEVAAGKSFEVLERCSELWDDLIIKTMCTTALTTYGFVNSIPLIDRWKKFSTTPLNFEDMLQQCNVRTPSSVEEMYEFVKHFSLDETINVGYHLKKEFKAACDLNKVLQEKERLGKAVEDCANKNAVKRKM